MGNIVLLDDLTINKIAAGEVIERPASVVKEMVENSIDAGAQNISVEIKNGGISFIKITDDGSGISEDDMEIAFERHATSKIRSAIDLETVMTMGFRGEALASIAAIANVEMISKKKGEDIGHKIVVEGGKILEKSEIGCPVGTTITVRNLFYNTPVRYKFLKKDYSEAGYIEEAVRRIALVNKSVSLKLISNGKTIINTNGSGDFKNIVYSIYGKDIANGIMEVDNELDGIKVSGIVGKPEIARANRQNQIFFVNGRYVKDKNLTAAVDQAYKGFVPVGKYGFVILNLSINPKSLDVNVHPAKLEVRFQDENAVFKAVYNAIKIGLSNGELVANIEQPIDIQNRKEDEEKNQEDNLKVKIEEGMSLEERIKNINNLISEITNKTNEIKDEPVSDIKNNDEDISDDKVGVTDNTTNFIEDIYKSKLNNKLNEEPENNYDKLEETAKIENTVKIEETAKVDIPEKIVENKETIKYNIEDSECDEETKVIKFGDVRISSDTEEIDTSLINSKLREMSNEINNKENVNHVENINVAENIKSSENSVSNQEDKKNEFINAVTSKILEAKLNNNEMTEMVDAKMVKDSLNEIPEITPEFEKMYKKAFGIDINKNLNESNSAKINIENFKNENLFEAGDKNGEVSYKFIGIAFSTYIIVEIDDTLYMIDQHAAHERIMYEKIKANYYNSEQRESQILLIPDIIRLTSKEIDIAKENALMFVKAGFEFEEFGENTLKLTSVPSMCEDLNTKQLFIELLDEIDTVAVTATQEKEDKFIATIACKSAVKANMKLNIQEINSLMKKLLKLPNPFSCPHGRPTAIKMTKYDIERKFSRK